MNLVRPPIFHVILYLAQYGVLTSSRLEICISNRQAFNLVDIKIYSDELLDCADGSGRCDSPSIFA